MVVEAEVENAVLVAAFSSTTQCYVVQQATTLEALGRLLLSGSEHMEV